MLLFLAGGCSFPGTTTLNPDGTAKDTVTKKGTFKQPDKVVTQQDKGGDSGKTVKKAVIEGSLSYPSEYIPADMKVCAQDLSTQVSPNKLVFSKEYCTSKHIKDKKYKNGQGYKLEVPGSGSYYVYAATSVQSGYKAYYSEYVVCGLKASCRSHAPIGVKINPGQTMTGIDPGDWYNF